MSIVIVGVMLVAALDTLGASTKGIMLMSHQGQGCLLAQELMSEILQQAYEDPDQQPVFGREPGESGGSRADFDDVDDYHNWSKSSMQYRDGTLIPNQTGWGRSVVIEFVNADNPLQAVVTDQGAKRITVTVTFNGDKVASMVAVRTRS